MRFQKKDTGTRALLWATIAVIILLGFDFISGGVLRAVFRTASSYVWQAGSHTVSAVAESGVFSSRRQLAAANTSLQSELDAYHAQDAAQAALIAQNKELQALVNLAQKNPGVTVPIVSSTQPSPYGTFLIGAGTIDGIVLGDLVLTADGFVAGRISDVQKNSATVTELFAPTASLNATLAHATITLEGQGGENARAQMPRSLSVLIGDIVTSPAAGGLPVGVVGRVVADPASAYQEVYVRLPINLPAVRYVYVRRS